MTTAEVNWPCTRGAKTLDDSFPDVPEAVTHSTPRLKAELVKLGLLSEATDKAFGANSTVGRDYIWTETACHIIRQRKPNLLLLHLLNVDSTHHAEGAQSPPGYTANAYADMCVAKGLAALDEAGIRAKTTVLLVADHGFTLTPKAIRPNAVFRKEGMLTLGGGGKITEARVHVISEGGTGLVYCTDPSSADADRKRVKELLAGKEGVAEVLEPAEFAKYGLPHPRAGSRSGGGYAGRLRCLDDGGGRRLGCRQYGRQGFTRLTRLYLHAFQNERPLHFVGSGHPPGSSPEGS